MSNPSDGPSTGRTVLNLSQVEEQLFGCGTYWFLRLEMLLASMDHRQKRKHPAENYISTKTSQVPSETMQKRETTDLSLNSVQLQRGPMGCLTRYPVLLGAQTSSHHLSGPRVFIWSQLWLNASTCLLLMHSVCTCPSICILGFKHHTRAL